MAIRHPQVQTNFEDLDRTLDKASRAVENNTENTRDDEEGEEQNPQLDDHTVHERRKGRKRTASEASLPLPSPFPVQPALVSSPASGPPDLIEPGNGNYASISTPLQATSRSQHEQAEKAHEKDREIADSQSESDFGSQFNPDDPGRDLDAEPEGQELGPLDVDGDGMLPPPPPPLPLTLPSSLAPMVQNRDPAAIAAAGIIEPNDQEFDLDVQDFDFDFDSSDFDGDDNGGGGNGSDDALADELLVPAVPLREGLEKSRNGEDEDEVDDGEEMLLG